MFRNVQSIPSPHPHPRPTPPLNLFIKNIADERASRLIDRDLMKTSLSMLSGLGVDGVAVYEEDFENEFLATTRAFYRGESQVRKGTGGERGLVL